MLFTPVATVLLMSDEWTMLNNVVLTTFIKLVSSTMLTHVPSCCNNYCSFIKREQVVRTMLLTIVAWTTLFRHDNNLVQATMNNAEQPIDWNDKSTAIFDACHECFLQVVPVLFSKMADKNIAWKSIKSVAFKFFLRYFSCSEAY